MVFYAPRIKQEKTIQLDIHKLYIVLFLLITIVTNTIDAQSIVQPKKYTSNIQKFTTENGLSDESLGESMQDSRGVLWLASDNGLNRFDGQEFKVFTTEDGLLQNQIHRFVIIGDILWCIYFNRNGYGDFQNFSLFHTIEERTILFEEYFGRELPFYTEDIIDVLQYGEGRPISFIVRKAGNEVLFGYTKKNGFKEITCSEKEEYHIGDASQDHIVQKKGTNHYLKKVDTRGNEIFKIKPELSEDNHLVMIGYGQKDVVWLHSNEGEGNLLELDKTGNITYWNYHKTLIHKLYPNTSEPILSWRIRYLPEDDAFAMAYKSHFFIIKTNGKLVFLTKLEDVQIDSWVIGADETNAIYWVRDGQGFYQIELNENHFINHLANQNLSSFRGISKYNDELIFGSYSGTFLYSQQYKTYSNLNHNSVSSLIDKDENLWLAINPNLVKYNLETQEETKYNLPASREVWSMYLDSQNRIWYSWNGLRSFDINTQKVEIVDYNEFEELEEAPIYHIYKKNNGNFFLCSTIGLYEWNIEKGIIAKYWEGGVGKYKLPTSDIRHLYYEEKDKSYWLATGNKGLVHWKQETQEAEVHKFHRFKTNTIHAVYSDDYGFLWMSTDNGIVQFNQATNLFRVYLPKDGTSTHEFNRISHFKDNDGTIYFGSINGVTSFHPKDFIESIKEGIKPKLIVLDIHQYKGSSYRLENVTVDFYQNQKIRMKSGDRFFTIRLTLDNYKYSKNAIYYYRVKDVDKEWTKSNNNEISISGLPYGNQIVEVKTSMSNGQFSDVLGIPVRVLHPFYMTWWFMFSVLVLLGGGIFYFIRWRTQQFQVQQTYLKEEVKKRTATIEQQAEELRELDQTKSRFFANVSHELRTPLTLILGPINTTLKRGDLTNRDFTMLMKAKQSGKNLLKLIGSILDLSKMESNKIELFETPTILFSFIRRLVSSFESHAEREGIQFSFSYQAEKDLQLLLDKEKLEVILNNLLSNAMKFTPKGGQVAVILTDETNQILLTVKDTGRGIYPDDLPNVFNRFYQSNQKGAPTEGGTGIGLALSKEFTKLMKGDIWVESEWTQGSTFFLQLPRNEILGMVQMPETELQPEKNIQTEATSENLQPTSEQQLLIVEDNHVLRDYLKLILEPYFNIQTAENGQVALDVLTENYQNKQQQPDLIISDVMMPEMDGFQLLTILKSRDYFRNIPVIMLTARAELQDKLKALRVGVDDYMIKPFDEEELLTRIASLLRNYEERKEFINNEILNKEETTVIEISEADQKWLEKAETIITNEIANSLFSVDYLAEQIKTPRKKLYKKVKQLTGLTPNQYIRTIRLKIAKDFLEQQTYKTVKEVAHQVGFQRVDYFSNLYKKEYGKSPIQYLR